MRDCYVFLHISHAFFILAIAGRNQMKFWYSFRFFYWSKGEGAFDIKIVSRFFRKNKSGHLVAGSQPAMISDSRSSSAFKR